MRMSDGSLRNSKSFVDREGFAVAVFEFDAELLTKIPSRYISEDGVKLKRSIAAKPPEGKAAKAKGKPTPKAKQ